MEEDNSGVPRSPVKLHYIKDYMVLNAGNPVSWDEKVYGLKTDNKLIFQSHINELCKETSQKNAPLSRLSIHTLISERKIIFKSEIKSKLSYIQIFCSRT